jgi:hypothetical protein
VEAALRIEPWAPAAYHWRGVARQGLAELAARSAARSDEHRGVFVREVAAAHADFGKAIKVQSPVEPGSLYRRGAAAEMLGWCDEAATCYL